MSNSIRHIEGWVSDKILEDNCIAGWAINTDDPQEYISVTVSIGEHEFNVVCNSLRKRPKKYKNYLNHGFRIYLSAEQVKSIKLNSRIILMEQNSQQVIYRTKIKESSSFIYTKLSEIEQNKKIELIKNSHFFNEAWYRKNYAIPASEDCAAHYLLKGWKQLFNPSLDFSTFGYFVLNTDVFKAQVNPLLHYETQFKKNKIRSVMSVNEYEGGTDKLITEKKPDLNIIINSKYFDKNFYNEQLSESESDAALDYPVHFLAMHYLYIGWQNHLDPSSQFSSDFYLNMSLDVKRAKINPLLHYERGGINTGRQIAPSIKKIEKELTGGSHSISDNYVPASNKEFSVSFVIVDCEKEGSSRNDSIQSILSQKNCNKYIFLITDKINSPESNTDDITVVHDYSELINQISSCNCDYVAFVSSGDVFTSPVSVTQAIDCLEEQDSQAICSYVSTDNADNSYVHHYRCLMHNHLLSKCTDHITDTRILDYSFLSNIVIKSKLIQKLNFDKCNIRFNLTYWILSHLESLSVKISINKIESVRCFEIRSLSEYNIKNLDNDDFMKSVLCKLFGRKKELNQYSLSNSIREFNDEKVFFSIILPSFNRAFCIQKCLDAVLDQSYQNFEIIIVDDGSSDDTESVVLKNYSEYINNGKITYFYQENKGVSRARNKALSLAKGDWICYVDSDNVVSRDFLKTFAYAIKKHRNTKMFYGKLLSIYSRLSVGRDFDRNELLRKNYIDMGTLCHSRELYDKLGGFDENLTKCVDWDLVLRYSRNFKPIFINRYVLFYNDGESFARISNTEKPSFNKAIIQSKNRFLDYPLSYTVIQKLLYNSSKKPVLSIKNPTPVNEKIFWGDYWLGMDLKNSLKNNNFIVRTDYREYFRNNLSDNDDIEFVIRGLNFYAPSKNKLSILYIISHPDLVTNDEIRLYDIILCASNTFAEKLKEAHPDKHIYYVPQFTNPTVFTHSYDKQYSYDLFFCGNTRHSFRDSVKFAVNNGLDISVFGRGWEEYVPSKFIKGQTIDNRTLYKYYSSSKIVLNDHHSDMKELGFISNRIYDVSSCGGFLISDYMPEIYDIYKDSIPMYKDEHEYVKLVKYFLDEKNEKERLNMAETARNITIKNFTADAVAKRISDIITDNKK